MLKQGFFKGTWATYLYLVIISTLLGISSYLESSQGMPTCGFCVTLRLLLLILAVLAIGNLLLPSWQPVICFIQLLLSAFGLVLGLRQFYFERFGSGSFGCKKLRAGILQTPVHWLHQGAPICYKTSVLGHLTLTSWACIVFSSLIVVSIYLYQLPKPKTNRH